MGRLLFAAAWQLGASPKQWLTARSHLCKHELLQPLHQPAPFKPARHARRLPITAVGAAIAAAAFLAAGCAQDKAAKGRDVFRQDAGFVHRQDQAGG